MKNNLKEHRKLKNLTQEELSKSSGISIRTIQRMEKGLSIGSSHTLKTLAKTLNIESTDILHDEDNSILFSENNVDKLKLINFSILTMLVIPFGNIIFPSIIFFRNRKDGKINTIGKKILSFQILSMFFLPFFFGIISLFIGKGNGGFQTPFYIYYVTYGIGNIIIVIHTSIKINQEKEIFKFVPNIL